MTLIDRRAEGPDAIGASTPHQPTTTGKQPSAAGFRADIEGLRAVAVLLVIADHFFAYPTGGFVGVDVFFVISGFLITGLLIREREKSGRISFGDFYRRRARRILPAAVAVIVVTVVAAQLVFLGNRGQVTLVDGIWAALFAANIRFSLLGTDYFGSSLPPSPLQHFWSLAVEEQFYILWPWLLLLAFALPAWSVALRTARRRVGVLVAAIVVVGFGYSMVVSAASPTSAYFSTFSRAWELGVGALLAAGITRFHRLPTLLRPVLAWLGLLIIAASALLITDRTVFPGPWAIGPVLGSALIIAAGSGSPTSHWSLWPLTNALTRYIGRISYSLYLWHWPVAIIFLAGVLPPSYFGKDKLINGLIAVVVAIAISMLSFHFVEEPVRRSNWLQPGPVRPKTRVSATRPLAAVLVLLVVAGGAAAWSFSRAANAQTAASARQLTFDPQYVNASLQQQITAGLGLTAWPELTPSLDNLSTAHAPILDDTSCINDRPDIDKHCVIGAPDAGRHAVLLGDSIAMSWQPGLEAAVAGTDWNIDVYGKYGCSWAEYTVADTDGSAYNSCDQFRVKALTDIAAESPDLVIVSQSWGATPLKAAAGQTIEQTFEAGVTKTLSTLRATGAEVVVLEAPPYGISTLQCATAFHSPRDCQISMQDSSLKAAGVLERLATGADAKFVPTVQWFCSTGGVCPPVVNGIVMRSDSVHLTADYSRTLSNELTKSVIAGAPWPQ